MSDVKVGHTPALFRYWIEYTIAGIYWVGSEFHLYG